MDYPNVNEIQFEDVPEEDQDFEPVILSAPPPPRDTNLDEAERRIAKANCYKSLLHDPFFEPQTQVTSEVEREIKAYVKSRFEELLGMGKPKPQEELTSEEVKILKRFVAKVQQQQTAPPPQPAPVVATQAPQPTAPARKRAVQPPAATEPTRTVKQPTTPPKIKTRSPQSDDLAPQEPAKQPAKEPARKGRPPLKQEVIATDSSGLRTIRKGVKVFKETVTPSGRTIMVDVTPQVRPGPGSAQPVPNLNPNAQGAIMTQQAAQQVGTLPVINTAETPIHR